MTPLEMIAEWRKGCSCAPSGKPEECHECTRALIDALEAALKETGADISARFALFGGRRHDEGGGWGDFMFSGSLDDCKGKYQSWLDSFVKPSYEKGITLEWGHIVDLASQQEILVADVDGSRKVIWRDPGYTTGI